MITNPVLPKAMPCKNSAINLPIINCSYWSTDGDCKTNCSLKIIESPDLNFCLKCDKRNPIENSFVKPSEIKNNILDLKNLEENRKKYTEKIEEKIKESIQRGHEINKKQQNEKSFLEKTTTYLKAESSQATQGKISKENFEKRKEICLKCEYRANDIVQKNGQPLHDTIGWCKGGCGCTVGNPRAALSEKLYMPTLRCPKGKFAEEKGEGFKVEDTIDSVKGIIKSVKNLLGKDPSNK
jgi:hypothetical protein